MNRNCVIGVLLSSMMAAQFAFGERQILDGELHHLRADGPREWADFPEKAEATHLELSFQARENAGLQTLVLRHQDLKQTWVVMLNGKLLARLARDENDSLVYLPIPPGALKDGENTLRVEQAPSRRGGTDDVRIGEIVLDSRSVQEVLGEAAVEVTITDGDSNKPLPARITIVNQHGALQSVGAASNDHLAVRPGLIYTADGKAGFGVPAGQYTIYAGRGFEYSLASREVNVAQGQTLSVPLPIRHEVPTPGYVACDTHVHTLTHSGHGDALVQERMVTLAAEGIELPIATDHNVHIDHEPFAREMSVRRYFTPVIGNEVTTKLGHFNVFPVKAGAAIPNFRLEDWTSIFSEIYRTPDVKVVILNHARDIHAGLRPFGPKLHNAVVGENLEGWTLRANAMEVVNSSATQTDVMQLFHDWMGLLNAGRIITPVGSSDSHDVGRHFVGQGRTYIRCDDRDPANIDVDQAVNSFLQGRVMVSYGLATELTVNGKYQPGETVPTIDPEVDVHVRVLGPHWIKASHVMLYANGHKIREANVSASKSEDDLPPGVKWTGHWALPKPKHDVHLVAIALGPGIEGLYWPTAKAYQPTSTVWEPHVIGSSGAVWLDVDGDSQPTPARAYALQLFDTSRGELGKLISLLKDYDEAVASQAAHLVQASGTSLLDPATRAALVKAAPATRAGFEAYLAAWRQCQIARGSQ